MLKQNIKEYNNKWQRQKNSPIISFSKNPWMDKNYIDRFLLERLLKAPSKIKTFNIYKKINMSNIKELGINTLNIYAYNNFLKNKQNIYKENKQANEFENEITYWKTKIISSINNKPIKFNPFQRIKLNEITTLKGYLDLNFENFTSKGKNIYITGNNPLKNKIIIDIGSHITTISYKKIIFEQRELFQIRKIFNEKSGKNTHIFNLLKTICKYTFSSNELNNNVLFKTYLNRIHVKYLNKNGEATKTISQINNETNEKIIKGKRREARSNIQYLLKNLNKSKKMNLNIFFQYWKKKNLEKNITNNNSFLFQNNVNEKNKNNWNNWGKINNYIYTNEKKTNVVHTVNQINNVEYINIRKLQKEQEDNQLNLFKYLHKIFFKTNNTASEINKNWKDNNNNVCATHENFLGQYLENIEFINNVETDNIQKNEYKNINYLNIEKIKAFSTKQNNWITTEILAKIPEIQEIPEIPEIPEIKEIPEIPEIPLNSKITTNINEYIGKITKEQPNNENKTKLKKNIIKNLIEQNKKKTWNNEKNNNAAISNNINKVHAVHAEKIILLPIVYEKNTIEIKENLDKIHNIHYFNFEGNNQESYLIGNENYPWNIITNKENISENYNKEIEKSSETKTNENENEININKVHAVHIENNNKIVNVKDITNGNKTTPYISITYLTFTLNRLIHKKSIEFIFTTKHIYASMFYLKYYWLYLYNYFYPDFIKMDWNIPFSSTTSATTNKTMGLAEQSVQPLNIAQLQKNNITKQINDESNESNTQGEKNNAAKNYKKTENVLQKNFILSKNKKVLSTNLHVQYLKSRYYLKMINTNYFQKNNKNQNLTNGIYSRFNKNSAATDTMENTNIYRAATNNLKQNNFIEKNNKEDFNLLNTYKEPKNLEKQKESYLNLNKGNYTKKLIALLVYKKKQKNINKNVNNFNINHISLNNSNQAFLLNVNQHKLTILQADITTYNSLNLIDLSF